MTTNPDITLLRRRERYEVHSWTDAGLQWMNDNVVCVHPGLAFINHDAAQEFAEEAAKAGINAEIKG
jgi:hypothetical protein